MITAELLDTVMRKVLPAVTIAPDDFLRAILYADAHLQSFLGGAVDRVEARCAANHPDHRKDILRIWQCTAFEMGIRVGMELQKHLDSGELKH